MGLISNIRTALTGRDATRDGDWPNIGIDDWSYMLTNLASQMFSGTLPGQKQEIADGSFRSVVDQAYKSSGVVFAATMSRMLLFSEAQFKWRNKSSGAIYGTPALDLLERPWTNATTGDLLVRMEAYNSTAGNAYVARRPGRLKMMRPDWVTIVMGSNDDPEVTGDDLDADLLGYLYHPGGRRPGVTPIALLPNEVAHYAPIPDPLASYRGMSWAMPVLREIAGDLAITDHKLRFFENGATPNMVVTFDKEAKQSVAPQAFRDWVDAFRQKEPVRSQAFKTMYLAAGAQPMVLGRDMQQIDLKHVQGAGETRMAAAAGIHPIIVGLSEGLAGSSLNAGNFGAARRLTADKTMRPLWRNACGSLASIILAPIGSELWYDEGDIAFLREDRKDAAEIMHIKASSIRTLLDAGFKPDSVTAAVEAENPALLVHTGLFSVQLQPPGTTAQDQLNDPAAAAGRAFAQLLLPYMPPQLALPSGREVLDA